jgi:ankyrin repeat protein
MGNSRKAILLLAIALTSARSTSAQDIFELAEEGRLDEVRTFVSKDPQLVHTTDNRGYTPLHLATYNGQTEVAEFLLSAGAETDVQSASGSTPMHGAAYYGHPDALRVLIEHGAQVDIVNAGGFTPLMSACAAGHPEIATLLLANGADANAEGDGSQTALIQAVQSGNAELTRLLLEHGADANAQTTDSTTALFRALWRNDSALVSLLLDHQADVEIRTRDGISLLYFAVAYRGPEISDRMIEKGSDFAITNQLQMTMLHYAAARGFTNQVEMLLRKGADPDARCVNGKTPLYYASIWDHTEAMALLMDHGADATASQPDQFKGDYLGFEPPGRTPRIFAESRFLTPFTPHGALAFSPDGNDFLWCHHALPIQAMWRMTREGDTWSLPEIAPFTDPEAEYWDGSPSFSHDGSRLFFHSHHPVIEGGEPREDADIWYVEKDGEDWGSPIHVGSPVNTDKEEFEPTVSASGDLYYVGSNYDDGLGTSDIYAAELIDGEYTAPRNLGTAINTEYNELSPILARDDSYLLFVSNRPYLRRETLRLYVSFRQANGSWTDAVALGRTINQGHTWHPFVTADGEYVFFQRGDDYHWISSEVIEDIRKAVLGPGDETVSGSGVQVPTFRKSEQIFEHASTNDIELGDLDGDGDLDAVFSNMGFNDSRIYLNDGTGHFVTTDQLLSQQGHGVELGDLDGDGDLDIFITCAGYGENNVWSHRPSKVYLNDGNARFSLSGQDLGDTLASGNDIWLHDIDGDSDLDAMVLYYQEPNGIYLNDGHANYVRSESSFPDGSSFGDLDGDGDIDLFVREPGSGFSVRLNDGSGSFIPFWEHKDTTTQGGAVALSDLDGDGDPDAIITRDTHDEHNWSTIWYNDGTGQFTESDVRLPIIRWAHLDTGDLNRDGHPDILLTSFGLPSAVWLNDGSGGLLDNGVRLRGVNMNGHFSLGDLDGDGDLDIIVAAFGGGPNEIWFNE